MVTAALRRAMPYAIVFGPFRAVGYVLFSSILNFIIHFVLLIEMFYLFLTSFIAHFRVKP